MTIDLASHSNSMPETENPSENAPKVYIVGAGCGNDELLTVKAANLIARADRILYADSLVPKSILARMRPDAEAIATSNKTLEEIMPLLIEGARAGKRVVRLHSGDPSLYGAIGEQMRQLAAAGIEFEIVPGISAFQVAAARLGVELTVPERVQTIILTRMSRHASKVPEAEELSSLAAHRASLCLYLSARFVEEAQEKIMAHYSPDTPVAICYRLGWEDERIEVVPLSQMAAVSRRENLIRTVLYVISPALEKTESDRGEGRSQLYHPHHRHLFRPQSRSAATTAE